jgi:hypothetical protein
MALDPLTALSLAGTIVQLVDFGSKIFSTAYQLHRSSTGALSVNEEIETVTSDLLALATKLRRSVYSSDVLGCLTQDEQMLAENFDRVCNSAVIVADEILQRLDMLQVKGKRRAWKSFRQAFKAVWSKAEIAKLLEKLSKLRTSLETHVLVSLRYFVFPSSNKDSTWQLLV